MMGHGKHDSCVMCRTAKSAGILEDHPDDCKCEDEKDEDKHQDEHEHDEHTHAQQ